MKIVTTLLLYVAVALAYDDINDNYLGTVLNNDKLLEQLFGCMVDVNPCDDFGAHVKSHIVEALSDNCRECDNTHKHYMHAYIFKLRNDFPDLYEKYEAKYDPSRTLLDKLDKEMIKYL